MLEIKVSEMTCGSCALSIKHVLKTVDPEVEVKINLQEQIVFVNSTKNEETITKLIEEAGFPVLGSKQIT